ncbi:acetyl-CoA C-acetyltransferase [Streptococcus suis]|uniref:acetyl-CoA C-acetyltransferase n=1 Tax=Streptococcus suis TaxID=1307 RepID=UPI00020777FA|nr:acetyl-CoA C-acetyltransferase [Streptococcus suis]AEB81905.1 acetyl-CoA acetyltransferase [Streptococcus suis ST3]AGW87837.1 3-ketoacyl-CoA thiolase / Acetyl-CoA acetyltransferase [Streptococcus suis YB51]NQF64900.1 acetyl-CoA C-acetyltransferase [Streptococcus suis]NQF89294.1 acetyl-CoA C-acetyltransferase [Streptococcus suis]NQG30564.1 acetyl-CoA C-acetyltransferase [Streptococcus suis]
MKKVAIVSAYRSAIGSFGGSLKDIEIADLGAQVLETALANKNIPADSVDEVIFGNVLSAGQGQNIARQIAIRAGIPQTASAYAVNKVCGSGLKSVLLAAQSIMLGDNDVVVAGGIEIMSQAPYLSKTSRFGSKFGHVSLEDSMLTDGLTDAFNDYHMGITAENVAERYHVSRAEQDAFTYSSQEKAAKAIAEGRFVDEIVPIRLKNRKGETIFATDEYPRLTPIEKLATLRPSFKKEGTVTAANASGINDGCAVLVLMSDEKASELNIQPLAYIEAYATSGLDPALMGLGPITASQKALQKLNKTVEDIDLFELNEAFAAQSIPVVKQLGIDPAKVNVNGGAIALGHPIGASGSRILVTLIHELIKQEKELGLCSLCIGGGQGISLIVSNAQTN